MASFQSSTFQFFWVWIMFRKNGNKSSHWLKGYYKPYFPCKNWFSPHNCEYCDHTAQFTAESPVSAYFPDALCNLAFVLDYSF